MKGGRVPVQVLQSLGPEKSPMSPSPWFVGLEEGELGGEQSEGDANLWASSQNKWRGFIFPNLKSQKPCCCFLRRVEKNPRLSQTLPLLPTPLSLLLLGGSASVDGPREGLWRVPQQCPEDCLEEVARSEALHSHQGVEGDG